MDKKCKKFESLYLFRSESELEEHLKECPECLAEQEKMDKVSELIKEVRPYYIQQRKRSFTRLKVACILCFGLFTGMLMGYFTQIGYNSATSSAYYETTQTTNDYGMPIDSYGLISLN